MTNWDDCQKTLGISFSDESSLKQAFTHSSYFNENPNFATASNERLEFLGDAILNFTVAERLFTEFPKLPEGELTKIRASLVCRETLAELASALELGDWLLLGQGEEASGGRTKQSNLANVMEALIGAIYRDQGLNNATEFILKQLNSAWKKIKAGKMPLNYKALIQEFIQGDSKPPPAYHLIKATGPDHDKQFIVEILVEGEALGTGTGKNKKAAETQAARVACEKLRCSHG